MDSVMTPMLDSMEDMDWTNTATYTGWTAGNFPPTALGNFENTLNASFTIPPTGWPSCGLPMADLPGHMYDPRAVMLTDVNSAAEYVPLDDNGSAAGFVLPLERYRSVSSDAKEDAKDRRRAQNRNAQRAYRQRREKIGKYHENEIETLKSQVAKEKKLNQALAKLIEALKERLKEKQPGYRAGAALDPEARFGNTPSGIEGPSCVMVGPTCMDVETFRISAELPMLERTDPFFCGSF